MKHVLYSKVKESIKRSWNEGASSNHVNNHINVHTFIWCLLHFENIGTIYFNFTFNCFDFQ